MSPRYAALIIDEQVCMFSAHNRTTIYTHEYATNKHEAHTHIHA